jgi:outer membrane autotransporter protein
LTILSGKIDIDRIIGWLSRLDGALFGGPGTSFANGPSGGAPFYLALSGPEDGSSTRFMFSTSLQQILQASRKEKSTESPMGLGPTTPYATGFVSPRVDVWVEGQATRFQNDADDSDGHVGLVYFGADYQVMPGLIVGSLLQFYDMAESSSALDSNTSGPSKTSGRGWMAGPYFAARLTSNLYLDARAAWGSSDNTVKPFATYVDQFDTDNWLARADLTGNWEYGPWRFTPSVDIAYYQDKQLTYIDSNAIRIASQTVTLGRLIFGPEIGYRFNLVNGSAIEPQIALQGIWDFDDANASSIVDGVVVGDDLRAKLQVGAQFLTPRGYALRATGAIDGLFDDNFKSYNGQLLVNIPLN